jgi:hypothetical protein
MVDFVEKNSPEHWRHLAHQTRADAGRQTDPETKKALLDVAALYDRLAEIATKRTISKTG